MGVDKMAEMILGASKDKFHVHLQGTRKVDK